MSYLDTSVIVASSSSEASTQRIQAWPGEQDPALLMTSDWTVPEMSSALAIRSRDRRITLEQRAATLALFDRLAAESLTILPISGSHFPRAARFVDQHTPGLRAGDALHLATASDHGAAVQTPDKRLAEAGPLVGVPTRQLA